jgi:hypothetical protein
MMFKKLFIFSLTLVSLLNNVYAQQIFSISPLNIIGGKGDVLTISGSSFGEVRNSSYVSFYNEQGTYTDADISRNFKYISWSDSEIKIEMPVAYSNKIKVIKGENSVESSEVLKVMANLSYRNVNPLTYDLNIDRNGSGGVTWYVHPTYWDNPEIRKAIADVVIEFRCKTGVNYVIERLNEEVPLSLAEGIHIISPDENLEIVGYNARQWSSCILGSETFYYNETQLLQFDTDVTWFYGKGQAPEGTSKFRYVLFHEMGHSLGLGHVNEEGQSMYPTVNFLPSDNWSTRDVITDAEETAIEHFVNLCQNFSFRACNINPMKAIENCEAVYGQKATLEFLENQSASVVFPNPTMGTFYFEVNNILIGEKYYVFSSLGREVLNGLIEEKKTRVFLDSLPTGIYFLRLGNNLNKTIKVIKN